MFCVSSHYNNFLSLLTIPLVVLLITSCNKYEDGPTFSLKSKKRRVLGSHKAVLYTVEGADSLAVFDWVYEDTDYDQDGLLFADAEGFNEPRIFLFDNGATVSQGGWDFSEDKTQIGIFFPENLLLGRSFSYSTIWNIRRLTNKEMWLDAEVDGRFHVLRFMKVEYLE